MPITDIRWAEAVIIRCDQPRRLPGQPYREFEVYSFDYSGDGGRDRCSVARVFYDFSKEPLTVGDSLVRHEGRYYRRGDRVAQGAQP